MRSLKRLTGLGLVLTLIATATPAVARPASRDVSTYEVTITNLTEGQWLTPPAVATHTRRFDAFTVGRPASPALQQIAENGNLDPFTSVLDSSRGVYDWAVAIADEDLPPLPPGESVTITLDAARGAQWLSYVSMLICTNDGFTGADTLRLPRRTGHSVTTYTNAYDAGTETNTEAWEDLVPPCALLTGFGDQGGTGMSNPDLAENRVIRHHRGIRGIADLVPSVHGWRNPVAKVEVTRVG